MIRTIAAALAAFVLVAFSAVAAEETKVHSGAILSAMLAGKKLLTGGDDGLVALTDTAGTVERLAERPRKWINHVAAGPNAAVAFAVGKQAVVRLSLIHI